MSVMDKLKQETLNNISHYGCHILHVMAEGELPPFSYSIGIEKNFCFPELVVVGLKRELAHGIINEYKHRIKCGELFEPNHFYPGFLEGFNVYFIEVASKHYSAYFGWGRGLYDGNNFRVMQLVYPTTSNIWPWDSNALDSYLTWQPLLNESGFVKLAT